MMPPRVYGRRMSRGTRTALILVEVIAIVVGAVFAGQGLNLIPGSFMTGDRTWLAIGLLVIIGGVVLISIGLRRSRRPRR